MTSPNWKENQERLFVVASEAVKRFAATHAVECSHFAFDADALYGYVLCSFDSPGHSLQAARESEEYAIKRRARDLAGEDGWKYATHTLGHPSVAPYCDNTGDFAFQHFAEVTFPEWRAHWESPDSECSEVDGCDDYLGGHVRVLLWQVVERLIEAKIFDVLRMASPFLISYAMHDEEQRVLRVLRWPQDS